MTKVMAICGKICSGKSYYSKTLKEKAVILSCDELTDVLFDNNLGNNHDEMSKRIWKYLLKKTEDIITASTNVILDWGFWSKHDRIYINEYFSSKGIVCEWHFINIDYVSWQKNIEERNQRVLTGMGGSDYYLDEGLMKKLLSKWETPNKEEIDVWFDLKR
ncbi:MAG: AAA family ATPase [Clostridia bacterium]|nr:AAA family ATPase [Clostridia bacterium]